MKVLKNLLNQNLKNLINKKGYKSFGDVLLNFLYSYHLYLTKGELKSCRVKNDELYNIIKEIKLELKFKDKKSAGDFVEALVGYCFINNLIDINEFLKFCSNKNFLKNIIKYCIHKICDNYERA